MMSASYILSRIAERDIDEIIDYIVPENPSAAYDFVDALYDAFEKLAAHPYLGHTREDLTSHPVRFWTFKWHYLVVYLYEKNEPLKIVRVLSGFRDIPNLL